MTKMEKEIMEQSSVLASLKNKSEVTLMNLVSDIKQRDIKLVYFAARGTSSHACLYASYLLSEKVGIPTAMAMPSVITVYDGALCLKDALVIGVSQSGKAADVMAVMDRAKRDGGLTLAITNDLTSPMAEKADYHLYCDAGMEESVAATKSFTAQMYLLGLLAAYWSDDKKMTEVFEKIPAAIDEELKYIPGEIDKTAQHCKDMKDCFVLSRGITLSVVMEAAMKLQETNYVKAAGYAISEFWHGPLAQAEQGDIVFLYAPEGRVLDNCREMLAKLDAIGAETILISDSEEMIKGRRLSILVPSVGSEFASPFMFAVFAQLFACRLTAVKGIDPDAPRNLNKVTITK